MRRPQRQCKVVVPTAWGTDWDYMWRSQSCHHTLCPYPRCFLEASIITIPLFQDLCPYESNQNFQLSYHIHGHHLFIRSNYYLISVVDGDEIGFMWQTSLIHGYLLTISWCIGVSFVFQKHFRYFLPEHRYHK